MVCRPQNAPAASPPTTVTEPSPTMSVYASAVDLPVNAGCDGSTDTSIGTPLVGLDRTFSAARRVVKLATASPAMPLAVTFTPSCRSSDPTPRVMLLGEGTISPATADAPRSL